MSGDRLEAVECKLAFVEELLDQLNGVVTAQQRQIDELRQRMVQLQDRLSAHAASPLARPDEEAPPPHY